MEVPKQTSIVPEIVPQAPRPIPQVVPPPERRRGPARWRWIVPAILLVGIGLYVFWGSRRAAREQVAGAVGQVPVFKVEVGSLERTLRVSGTIRAGKYASVLVPRLEGSRSGRGRTAQASLIQADSTITVGSTSTVARSSTASRLSQTGTVASTGTGSGGGFSGAPRSGSGAMRAATSRVGGSSSAGASGGTISSTASQASSALGSSGLGSTASALSGGPAGPPRGGGGGGGGGRGPRGDFMLALHKLIPAGTRVTKGDIVAEFDRQFMLLRLDDYRAALAQTEAAMQKGLADLQVRRKAHNQSILAAKSNLEKARLDIKATPVLSDIDAERLKLALEEAEAHYRQLLNEVKYVDISEKAQIRNAELRVQEAQVELRLAEGNVEKLVAKAPIDGMVVHLNVFRGGEFAQVREGDELWSGMPFLQIVEPSSMVVDARVNQVDAEKVRIGQKAYVRLDAFPDLVLPARVYSIGTVAVGRQYRQEYVKEVPVQLKLEQMDSRVIPDLSASVEIVLERVEQAVVAPAEAIFSDPDLGEKYVFVKRDGGWQRRPIEPGLRNHVAVAVRAGLEPGELVALRRPPPTALKKN